MTLQQLKKLYLDCSKSVSLADRHKAKGYSEIIKEFSNYNSKEISEHVKLSLVAEKVLFESEALYKATHKEIYKWYMAAARTCIIIYATEDDLRNALLRYDGPINESSLISFLNLTKYKDRIKYSSIHSIYNVMTLYEGDNSAS